jgi:hypothetical protein
MPLSISIFITSFEFITRILYASVYIKQCVFVTTE